MQRCDQRVIQGSMVCAPEATTGSRDRGYPKPFFVKALIRSSSGMRRTESETREASIRDSSSGSRASRAESSEQCATLRFDLSASCSLSVRLRFALVRSMLFGESLTRTAVDRKTDDCKNLLVCKSQTRLKTWHRTSMGMESEEERWARSRSLRSVASRCMACSRASWTTS